MRYLLSLVLFFQFTIGYTQHEQIVESIDLGSHLSPLVSIKKSGKTYYYHPTANLWIDEVDEHAADLFVVIKDGKYGLLQESGKLLIPIEYDTITLETRYEGQWYDGIDYDYKFAVLKRNGKVAVADEHGKIIVPFDYDDAKAVNKSVVAVSRNGLWGWVSATTGELLQEPKFEYVTNFYSDDFVEVRDGEKAGLARSDGQLIIPVQYDEYMRILYYGKDVRFEANIADNSYVFDTTGSVIISGHELYQAITGSNFLVFKEKDHLGIIDPLSKKVIVQPSLDYIGSFNRDLAIAKRKDKYGVVTIHGDILLDFEYDEISFLTAAGRYASEFVPTVSLAPNGLGGERDENMKARMRYDAEMNEKPYVIAATKNGLKGVFSWEGQPILPIGKYDGIDRRYCNGKSFYHIESKGKMGITDDKGKEILPAIYSLDGSYQFSKRAIEHEYPLLDRYISFSNGKKEGGYREEIGLFDLKLEKIVVPIAEQNIDIVSSDRILIRKSLENYESAFYSYDIKQDRMDTLPDNIEQCHLLSDRFWLLEMKNKQYRLIDFDNKPIYENPDWNTNPSYYLLRFPEYDKKNYGEFFYGLKKIYGKEGNLFINDKGEEKRFEGVDQVDAFYEGIALAAKLGQVKGEERKKYKYGMIDREGRVVLPFEFDNVYAASSDGGVLHVQKGEYHGLVRRDGTILLEPIFDDISFSSSYPTVMIVKDGKSGMADTNGKIIIAADYDVIRRNYQAKDKTWPVMVKQRGWYYLIDENGHKAPIKAKEKE